MKHSLRLSGLAIVCACGAAFGSQQHKAVAHLRAAPREDVERDRLRDLTDPLSTREAAERWGISRAAALTALGRLRNRGLIERGWDGQPPYGYMWRLVTAEARQEAAR